MRSKNARPSLISSSPHVCALVRATMRIRRVVTLDVRLETSPDETVFTKCRPEELDLGCCLVQVMS